ncbi:TIGR03560 family F420-dependent LLM class oxidoreductase [Amycolatopsis sp. PS_44_ISF1]|uniref:TIGR03560 family F420-dependent LLM class oxidoreductase n=1 Tax=Amycolatopsis sp. PS_44_ISF1 TaxID=2974917 RepID=UPI0028DF05DA|nr:TIGR03560 family F420-dependent LLM class oxidoreductase [Amycolatopsis sp. PS_44_ISF1]MDT8911920.1 TIGR03560 family F420-dependent LLM class oxidoreductase [Amycolatopsis sp. PS_44_ISF1]
MAELAVGAWLSPGWSTEDVLAVANEAEQAGYDSVWMADHFMTNSGTDEVAEPALHECFSLLAALAAAVPRVRLGSLVAGITYRHPAVLANMAATIDNVSGGRLVLGVGAGWQANEHAAYGIELGTVRERIDRFEEGLKVLRGLLSESRTTVEGQYYRVTGAPRTPVVRPRVPILIGAAGERRMLGLVAEYADEWNCWSDPEVFARKSAVLDEHCERVGRDPRSIRRTTQAVLTAGDVRAQPGRFVVGGSVAQLVDAIGHWREAGLDELIVPTFGPVEQARELYALLQQEVLPQIG